MYEYEMTDAAKAHFIKDVIQWAENEHAAIDLIKAFLDGKMTTVEIEDIIF